MIRELAENNFLKDFGQEGEVWHWSVVLQDLGVKSSFLEERLHDSWCESRWEKAGMQRVIDDRCEVWKKMSRQWVRKDVGRRSSSHVFIVDWVSIFFTSSSETDWKLKSTPNCATERLIEYRGQGDSSWVKIATNGSYLTVKEVRKALWTWKPYTTKLTVKTLYYHTRCGNASPWAKLSSKNIGLLSSW